MNMKSTIIIAAALLVSILGAAFLTTNALSGIQNGDAAPAAAPPAVVTTAAQDWDQLTVNSVGSVSVTPDKATLNLSFSLTGESAEKVNADLTEALSGAIADLKAAGIAAADMQTSGLSIGNDYYSSYGDAAPRFRGDTSVVITVRDVGKIATYIDIAAKKPGYSSCYFSYDVENRTDAYLKAMDQAIEEATLKAEALAKGMGRTVGAVLSVEEYEGYSTPLRAATSELASTSGIVEPGSIDVRATLKVTYILGNAQ